MRFLLIASLVALTGCSMLGMGKPDSQPPEAASPQAPVMSGDKITITKFTWAGYQNYKDWLTPNAWTRHMGQGYFAVAKDGRTWGLTGCTANPCVTGQPHSEDAIRVCQERSGGVPCVVFARDDKILVPYEIAD